LAAVIETDALRKEYGALVAVRDVSISVDAGQVVGLIGPNGAGKTTLLRMLGTLLAPSAGTASLFGCDLLKDYLQIRSRIGFLPDFFNLYNDLTLLESLVFFARAYGASPASAAARAAEALEYVELQEKRDDLIRHLSRGMVQRLGVASLIVHDPDLFLLDEPASGLDPKARIGLRRVLKKLSEEGRTIIISSHILTELSGLCSHIAVMERGRMMLYGGVEDVQREVTGGHRTRIRLLGDIDKARRVIDASGDHDVVESTDLTLFVSGSTDDRARAELNRSLIEAGVSVAEFAHEKANIEDLFLRISGEGGANAE